MACKSQLRMADGGELMRRFANRQPVRMLDGTPENMAQNTTPMSAQDAGAFAAMGGPQGVAPDAPAAAPAADPGRRQRMLDAGQRTQTFNPMMGNIQTEAFDPHIRQLALRDGGTVPGKGTGDKIPALYEPGEFVVSNDMLDAEPGLREQLHNLRGDVLAAKGKSVGQADAQAVKGGNTLRAATGGPTDWMSRNLQGQRMTPNPTPMQSMADSLRTPQPAAPVAAPAAPKYTPPPVDKGTGRYLHEVQTRPSVVVDGGSNRVGNGGVNAGGGVAQPGAAAGLAEPKPTSLWGKTKAAGSAVGSGVKSVATGSILDADVGAAAGRALRGGAPAAGSFANGLGRLALPVSMGATAAQMADTSTEEYAKRLDAPQDGSTLKDVGLRVMGGITDFNDMMTFGHASKLANWVDGKGYVDNETAGRSLTPAAPANTAQPAPAQPAPLALRGDATGPADHPNAPMADATSYLATGGRNGKLPEDLSRLREGSIYKTIGPNGNPIYSGRNVSGDAPMVDGKGNTLRMGGNVSTVPGMDPALIASTLRNPDGSTWSARDNAVMAANLRDGVDPYRGTSRAPKEEDRIPAIGEFGHNKAVANQTLRRGQDIQSADNRYGHDLSAATARANTRFQMQKDLRDFGVERYDKGIEQASKFSEQARGAFKNRFDTVDKDGKLVARPDREAAAYDEAVRQSGGRWDQLDPAQRAQYLNDAFDHVKLLSSARDHQNNSIWQAAGLANKDSAHGGMPTREEMQGAKLTELGFGSGATTMNAGRGDYKLTLKNGQVMHFGRGDLSQAQLKRLQDLGASLGDK
jgi:hypothetical protein